MESGSGTVAETGRGDVTRSRLMVLRTALEKYLNNRELAMGRTRQESITRQQADDLAELLGFCEDMLNDREYWASHASR